MAKTSLSNIPVGAETLTISLRSIDVGFDLRAVGQTAILPEGITAVLCDLPERGGHVIPREQPVSGNPAQILKRLRGLGYSVRYAAAGKVEV